MTIKEVSYRNFVDWRAQSRSFASMAAMGSENRNFVIDRAGEFLRIKTAMVSGNFFELLGVDARHGRAIVPSDDVRGAERVLVLGDRLWRQSFNTDPAVVGTPVSIGNQSYTIVGVMPPEFGYPRDAEAWVAVVPALAPDGKSTHSRRAITDCSECWDDSRPASRRSGRGRSSTSSPDGCRNRIWPT